MTVGLIFTKIGNFIENRHISMLLNRNCAKLANFEDFKTFYGGRFFVDKVYSVPAEEMATHRAKFGWPSVSDVAAVTKARRETR